MTEERGLISAADRRRPLVRWTMAGGAVAVLALLVFAGLGPILWLAKAAISQPNDIVARPLELWPGSPQWHNIADAWSRLRVGSALINTVWVALGNWAVSVLVATTGGYALSILRPRYAKVVNGALLATLFIPGVISLVPLYLTILDVPIVGGSLINTYWAIWLPAGASAFNVLITGRFFAQLPAELFEAAKIDGVGTFRMFTRLVLPLSGPIIGVVSLLSIIAAWREYLWPKLVLPDRTKQPLSVMLPSIRDNVQINLFMAGLLISVVLPIVIFLLFQRYFIRGAGLTGGIKG
ncbi:multiple sugar transport system permease protein [Kribbella sp. VKM Ac-2527]|uniref:Multiple sugar transport system permease protein n=1 Tax=Kribbella caucasensis TaxID=2512215 RepID=A0A4R6KA95_9ACTN|nr:carbohydrate ABC transporter permease [Kribbella sp. VKM Ac-2527]TDO46751.1 multiple sugar transport system permease protein [Kribbella sp. VKM Ac-2527]